MGAKELILGAIIWFFIAILLALPIFILFIWKGTVIFIAKCIRRNLRVLNPLDIIVAPGGVDKSIVNFGLVLTVEGQLSLEEVQLKFTEKFLQPLDEESSRYQYEKFHSNLVSFGGFLFAQILHNIEINDHIYIKQLRDDQILEDLISEWVMTRYKSDTPFWDIILVPLVSSNQTVVAFRIHHAFADGYSVLYILDELTGTTSPYLVKDFEESWAQKVSQMIAMPCHMAKLFPANPQSNPIACIKEDQNRWLVSFSRLDLHLLKKIRRLHNVQFSVLILSLIGGVIRKYLLETRNLEDLPDFLFMCTTLAWPKHPSRNPRIPLTDKMCNHWIAGPVQVPIKQDNPLERLLETQKHFNKVQESGITRSFKRLMPLMWFLPECTLNKMFSNDPGYSTGYSTFVGGEDYKLIGKPVSKIHPILAIHDSNPFIPISAFTFSHSNHLELTLAVTPQHFPNRDVLNRIVNEELPHELKRLSILSGIVENLTQ